MEGKVLITGSNGQLGQCFKKVVKTDNYIFTTREDFDICDKKMMRKYLKSHKDIKVIINCAAYTNVAKAEEEREKADLINHQAVADLAELCKEFDIFLIHFGTDYMYDYTVAGCMMDREPRPITEKEYDFNEPEDTIFYSDHGQFVNQYGLSKLRGVKKLFDIRPKFVVIVVSWLFSQYGKNFVKTIYEKIINKEQCSVVCTEIGSPTYGIDLAKYVLDEIEDNDCNNFINDKEHIINFSNLGSATWYDLAYAIEFSFKFEEYYRHKVLPTTKPYYKFIRPKYSVLDTTKLCASNMGKPYVRHWLLALEECLHEIRWRMFLEQCNKEFLVDLEK
jgi:dTDP-4-dehydrorhamnose reductase